MYIAHAHETAQHRTMKALIAQVFRSRGWHVIFEEQDCDVLAFKADRAGRRLRLTAIEAERSLRNLRRNVTRDLERGGNSVLVTVVNAALAAAVRRQLRRDLPRELWRRIGVVTLPRLQRIIESNGDGTPPGSAWRLPPG